MQAIKPTDTLLVVDAMTGQEAATLVKSFNNAAPITGTSGPHSCSSTSSVSVKPVFWYSQAFTL